jgi:pyruvate-formate lyase-activating enzyme
MPEFLCYYLNEITLLCDGRATTCCMDPLGINSFADINEDDYLTVREKYLAIREKTSRDVESLPRCKICYEKIKAAGFPETGTYVADPSPEELERFLMKGPEALEKFVVELTVKCNLRCNGCMQSRTNFMEYRARPFADVEALTDFLGAAEKISQIRLYNYGETFLHPRALDICEFLREAGLNGVTDIATNGLLLNDKKKRERLIRSGLLALIFSIHGGSQESASRYMTEAFDFKKMMRILADLKAIRDGLGRDSPKLVWRYLLFEWNDSDEETGKALERAAALGLDKLDFGLVGFPSPSRRFVRGGEEYRRLLEKSRVAVSGGDG